MKELGKAVAVCLLLAGLCGARSVSGESNGKRPPNVILVMADDLGYECIGAYGGPRIKPRISTAWPKPAFVLTMRMPSRSARRREYRS